MACTLADVIRTGQYASKPEKRKVFGQGNTNYFVCPNLCPSCKHLELSYSNFPVLCKGLSGISVAKQLSPAKKPEIHDACGAYEPRVDAPVERCDTSEENVSSEPLSPELTSFIKTLPDVNSFHFDLSEKCPHCRETMVRREGRCPLCGFKLTPTTLHDDGPLIKGIYNGRWFLTLLLVIVTGMFGGHRFYNGKKGTGFLMLITLGGFGWWYIIDLLMVISGNFTDKQGNKIQNVKDIPLQNQTIPPQPVQTVNTVPQKTNGSTLTDEEIWARLGAEVKAQEAAKAKNGELGN